MKKTILVTGGCGFIGLNFIKLILNARPDFKIINIDKITYAANNDPINPKQAVNHYEFIKGDINDQQLLNSIFSKEKPEYVVHFAAETHVDRSIDNAKPFIETNINGTYSLLETQRRYPTKIFVHISTDEVYGETLTGTSAPIENSALNPSNPYSVSKAAADMMVKAYSRTYGLNFITLRLCNNYGPSQYPEKLIPLMIKNIISNKKLPIYGKGDQIRDWLYVEDTANAILKTLEKGQIGKIYNVGAQQKFTNLEVVRTLCKLYSKITLTDPKIIENLIEFVKDRPGHDYRYDLNDNLFRNQTGWKPNVSFNQGIEKTLDWYIANPLQQNNEI